MNDVILCQHLNWHARQMFDKLAEWVTNPIMRSHSAHQNMAMFEGNLL